MTPRQATDGSGVGPVTLVHARYTVPVRPGRVLLEHHSVVVAEDRILAVLPRAEAESQWADASVVELPRHVLLPGLINCHTHAPMTLLRGYADDLELHVWLQEHIWPTERQFVGPQQRVAEDRYTTDGGALIRHFVQPALAKAKLMAMVNG